MSSFFEIILSAIQQKSISKHSKKSIVSNVAYPIPFIHISYSQKISHLCELIILSLFAELKDDKTHSDNSFEALNYYFVFLSDSNQLVWQTQVMSA
jgi:glycosylphosphatidylinositol transamidase (GPIT) subunit GPI8